MMDRSTCSGALEGIRVLDFSALIVARDLVRQTDVVIEDFTAGDPVHVS
jgi:hypothetical protein